MELQTGEFPGWDKSPVAFMRTCVVSQLVTIATTFVRYESADEDRLKKEKDIEYLFSLTEFFSAELDYSNSNKRYDYLYDLCNYFQMHVLFLCDIPLLRCNLYL